MFNCKQKKFFFDETHFCLFWVSLNINLRWINFYQMPFKKPWPQLPLYINPLTTRFTFFSHHFVGERRLVNMNMENSLESPRKVPKIFAVRKPGNCLKCAIWNYNNLSFPKLIFLAYNLAGSFIHKAFRASHSYR